MDAKKNNPELTRRRMMRIIYFVLIAAQVLVPVICFAEGEAAGGGNLWTVISNAIMDVYGKIVTISTIVAGVCAAAALLVRVFVRSQRAAEESTAWLKRIIIAWIAINIIPLVIGYISPMFAGQGTLTAPAF